jgi:glycosyltransferase involved in cell wall biosynthesis
MSPRVSLIVPVYNVAQYLKKALKSVEQQTFEDFEVIIVNDGSTDECPSIIDDFSRKTTKKLTVINQKNSGVSVARNRGIDASCGKYIAFMDSDDYIEKNFLSKMYKTAVTDDADIVCCNFNHYYPKNKLKLFFPIASAPGIYTKHKALKKLILDIGLHFFAWNKLYKSSLFKKNGIRFYDIYFEDVATAPRLFYHAEKIVVLGDALYNYTYRPSSIMNTMDPKKINDYICSMGSIRSFLESKNDYIKYKNHFWVSFQKLRIACYYNVWRMHSKSSNFGGFFKNISAINKSVDHFVSDEYIPHKNITIPHAVWPVQLPDKKRKTKAKKRTKNSVRS